MNGRIKWLLLDPPDVEGGKIEWGFGAAPLIVGLTVYAADLKGRVLALELERIDE